MLNVSNPAAFAVEWSEDCCRYQLVNLRGTSGLVFGLRRSGGDWSTVRVENPERFLTVAPRTFADFREVARTFYEAV